MAIAFALSSLGIQAQSDRFTCDESCVPDATGAVKYNVVSPVGFSTVEPIKMASRLTTLGCNSWHGILLSAANLPWAVVSSSPTV